MFLFPLLTLSAKQFQTAEPGHPATCSAASNVAPAAKALHPHLKHLIGENDDSPGGRSTLVHYIWLHSIFEQFSIRQLVRITAVEYFRVNRR